MSHTTILTIFVGLCFMLCLAKQNFEITLDRAEITDSDPEIIELSYVVNKYNRTFKTLCINFTFNKYLGYDVKAKFRGYAIFSNEYRPVLGVVERNVCDYYKNEFLWIKSQVEKYSNFPMECPLRPGFYYLKDFVPNSADFPAVANFPWTKFMFQLQAFYKNKLYMSFKLYVTLDHDAELKRMG